MLTFTRIRQLALQPGAQWGIVTGFLSTVRSLQDRSRVLEDFERAAKQYAWPEATKSAIRRGIEEQYD